MSRDAPTYYVKVVPRGTKGVRVDLTNRVRKFEFEDNESKADRLKLVVDNWDLRNFDTPVWRKGAVLEVSFGYTGNMAPARQMIIRKVTGSTELTIEAFSKVFLMDRVARCRIFENAKRSEIATRIAEENGFGPEVRFIEDTEEVIPCMTQAAQTDAHFLRRLATKEGFEFYVDFDGFHFHSRVIGQPPIRTLTWYKDERGTIENFTIENDITTIPGRTRTRGRDLLTKKDFEVITNYAKDFAPQLAPDAEVTAELLAASGNVAIEVVETTTEAIRAVVGRKARGRGEKRKFLTVKMKANIVGDPQLLAKTIIRIDGIGQRLSGLYYVKKHTHVIDDGGFGGELELLRDGHTENRAQERLFERKLGSGKGAGCLPVLRRVQVEIDRMIRARDRDFIATAKAGGEIPTRLSQPIGAAIRELRRLRPTLTEDPGAPTLSVARLREVETEARRIQGPLWAESFPTLVPTRNAAVALTIAAQQAIIECNAAGVTAELLGQSGTDALRHAGPSSVVFGKLSGAVTPLLEGKGRNGQTVYRDTGGRNSNQHGTFRRAPGSREILD